MNYFITPVFKDAVGELRLENLNSHPSTVYGLDSELNIAYQNPAAIGFSKKNSDNSIVDHCSLGKNIFDLIPTVLWPVYKKLFASAQVEKDASMISKQFEYECSSPELYRIFSMHIYPLGEVGLLVIHSLLIEEPHTKSQLGRGERINEIKYISKNGYLTQCSNCRRIKTITTEEQWDWVPKWVKDPYEKTTHGICKPCMDHYYIYSNNF